jgi:hypothetical protein
MIKAKNSCLEFTCGRSGIVSNVTYIIVRRSRINVSFVPQLVEFYNFT